MVNNSIPTIQSYIDDVVQISNTGNQAMLPFEVYFNNIVKPVDNSSTESILQLLVQQFSKGCNVTESFHERSTEDILQELGQLLPKSDYDIEEQFKPDLVSLQPDSSIQIPEYLKEEFRG